MLVSRPSSIAEAYRATHYPENALSQTVRAVAPIVLDPSRLQGAFDLRTVEQLALTLRGRAPVVDNDPTTEICEIRRNGAISMGSDGQFDSRVGIIELFRSTAAIDLISSIAGERRYPASIQLVRMGTGAQLAEHDHGADEVFVIGHLSKNFEGGDYYEVGPDGHIVIPEIPAYSIVVTMNGVHHGVTEVLAGRRDVIVSTWSPSKHKR